MSQHWLTLSVASALALGMAGCDSSGLKLAPVSGTILLDGKPMVRATITTRPVGTSDNPNPGLGSFGVTNDQGYYSLEQLDPPLEGAVLGTHRVSITPENMYGSEDSYDEDDEDLYTPPPPGSPWPTRYSDGSLSLTVTPGGITKDFELTLKR